MPQMWPSRCQTTRKGGARPGRSTGQHSLELGVVVLGWGRGGALEEGPSQLMHATYPTHIPPCLTSSPSTWESP